MFGRGSEDENSNYFLPDDLIGDVDADDDNDKLPIGFGAVQGSAPSPRGTVDGQSDGFGGLGVGGGRVQQGYGNVDQYYQQQQQQQVNFFDDYFGGGSTNSSPVVGDMRRSELRPTAKSYEPRMSVPPSSVNVNSSMGWEDNFYSYQQQTTPSRSSFGFSSGSNGNSSNNNSGLVVAGQQMGRDNGFGGGNQKRSPVGYLSNQFQSARNLVSGAFQSSIFQQRNGNGVNVNNAAALRVETNSAMPSEPPMSRTPSWYQESNVLGNNDDQKRHLRKRQPQHQQEHERGQRQQQQQQNHHRHDSRSQQAARQMYASEVGLPSSSPLAPSFEASASTTSEWAKRLFSSGKRSSKPVTTEDTLKRNDDNHVTVQHHKQGTKRGIGTNKLPRPLDMKLPPQGHNRNKKSPFNKATRPPEIQTKDVKLRGPKPSKGKFGEVSPTSSSSAAGGGHEDKHEQQIQKPRKTSHSKPVEHIDDDDEQTNVWSVLDFQDEEEEDDDDDDEQEEVEENHEHQQQETQGQQGGLTIESELNENEVDIKAGEKTNMPKKRESSPPSSRPSSPSNGRTPQTKKSKAKRKKEAASKANNAQSTNQKSNTNRSRTTTSSSASSFTSNSGKATEATTMTQTTSIGSIEQIADTSTDMVKSVQEQWKLVVLYMWKLVAPSILRFMDSFLDLHASAARALTKDKSQTPYLIVSYVFLQLFSSFVSFSLLNSPPWPHICIWYAFLGQYLCVGNGSNGVVFQYVLPICFVIEGVSHPSYLLDLNTSELMMVSFAILLLRTYQEGHVLLLLLFLLSVQSIFALLAGDYFIVQWTILVTQLSYLDKHHESKKMF